jgi:hypothetical protein
MSLRGDPSLRLKNGCAQDDAVYFGALPWSDSEPRVRRKQITIDRSSGDSMTRRLLRSKYAYRAFSLTFLVIITLTLSARFTAQEEEEGGIPAYNAGPPPKGTKLPDIHTKDQLWGADAQHPYQTHAYELAAKIPVVLHQQPCYCYCERIKHNSLHSCFENTHGARCATCLKELYYSYQQHKKGKTAAQIRAGIIKGDWKLLDLETAASID